MKVAFAIASLLLFQTASAAANPLTDSVIINNFVFDSSGSPWLDGWVLPPDWRIDTASSFFRDSPPGSSAKWSIAFPQMQSVSKALTHLSSGIFQLSCWAKQRQGGFGMASLIQGGNVISEIAFYTFIDSTHKTLDTNWREYFLTDTLSLTYSDTILIALSGSLAQIQYGDVLIDNISFVKLLPSSGVNTSGNSDGFQLGPNYPNPYRAQTTIPFTLAKPSFVTIKIFDMAGIPLCDAFSGSLNAGVQHISFDRGKLASGDYLYELTERDESGLYRLCKIMSVE